MFILDTNVVSNLRRRDKADRNVLAWSETHDIASFFMSVISILELEIGTLLLSRKDTRQATMYREWLDQTLIPQFDDRILSIDTAVVVRCANLHVPDPKPERDALIAATALVKNLTVVTRNTKDFEGTGVKLFNPWIPTKG
ncbi:MULTISPECIES: type II toxin-antitoxin system VapC family toxin [unclassified Mesorhizobium]|uniref:type II toxin-antitoxin system VapC family toxin n=1 Tax=unclassified Mesorhizobium TaxID=325217 RepID=UPI0003CEC776|nr:MULTISPECIES: type II toxin-antitoxin system VapC family toxin [unclassified Mesorhizobium]ESW66619.1 twitching motility protein PilT [Mesorhizobium sp. LSJC277A00]ESW82251.1 twitching motility protein PilT [Mesorhizobium sp. LSJC285A00]ESX13095.1 twitching motility protein PilT [Mesorhizobium sp. LSJC265A00]ESX49179.1 twitching motility protein PilT [Mesorhizobium sp. LSHC426A00]ESX56058.1 twitching motility protein PilT [Mesorhizobium sp. LSHC424B00]